MNMFSVWSNKIRASHRWVKALDLAAKRRYHDALDHLESIERLVLSRSRTRYAEFDLQVVLLKASMLTHLERYSEAVSLISKIDNALRVKEIENADYLRAYLSELARFAISSGQLSAPSSLGDLLCLNVQDIDLQKVPSHMKKTFPLPGHPM